jgi:hypothetical protein
LGRDKSEKWKLGERRAADEDKKWYAEEKVLVF